MWDCIVVGCPYGSLSAQKKNGQVPFHVFPHPYREPTRFAKWLTLINNPKFHKMNPMNVYKSMRICRMHFAADSYNGECKRLLPHAVPTLYLRPIALVQPMDSMGDELERSLREDNRNQLKRHTQNSSRGRAVLQYASKRPRIGITMLSTDAVENAENDDFVDSIIEFKEEYLDEEEYEDGSLTSNSKVSSVGDGEYIITSITGIFQTELDTMKQVEILYEPPDTLLNESSVQEACSTIPIEKGYELLVREFASEASNEYDCHYDVIIETKDSATKNTSSWNIKHNTVQTFAKEFHVGM